MDALIVAMDMLNRKTKGKRYQRRIFLVTDAGSPVNEADWNVIVDHFKQIEAKLNVIGIDFEEENGIYFLYFNVTYFPYKETNMKRSEKLLRKLAKEVDGIVVPVHQALEIMSYFRSKSVAQVFYATSFVYVFGNFVTIENNV